MADLSNLRRPEGSHRDTKRLGRGPGSGQGKTAGKGHKGSMARAGHSGSPMSTISSVNVMASRQPTSPNCCVTLAKARSVWFSGRY